ncbi:MAG: DUF533 domain-containing protein [Verrucomicrobiaceae bacterium]|nr:DUF533 domain-containing protein [Verrucomicrobiaceae bacterium]
MFDAKSLLDSLVTGVSEFGDKLQNIQPGETLEKARDVAGDALDQATSGVKDVASKAVDVTGVDEKLDAVVGKVSGGRTTEVLLEQAKDILAENKLAAGVALGSLGALLLGTKNGRKVSKNAAKIGGVALIGGLAYKALENFRRGKSLLSDRDEPEAAPADSDFASKKLTDDQALLLVRSMIAAAAADSQIDEAERMRITLGLREAGLDSAAADFLESEFKNPVSVDVLAAGADTPELASQVYTAARLTIEPDTVAEQSFLTQLGEALSLEASMVEHLDAVAASAKAA